LFLDWVLSLSIDQRTDCALGGLVRFGGDRLWVDKRELRMDRIYIR